MEYMTNSNAPYIIVTLCNFIFTAGWYIAAYLFGRQLLHLIKTNHYQAIDVKSLAVYLFICLNLVLWLYMRDQMYAVTGALAVSVVMLAKIVFYYRSKNKERAELSVFPYKAIIFDFDGVLVDTQNEIHAAAEVQVLKHYNVHVVAEQISKKYAGMSTKKVFLDLAPHLDPEMLYKQKWERVRKMIDTDEVRAIPGTFEILELAKDYGIPIVIASASPRWYLETIMDKTLLSQDGKAYQLRNYFKNNVVSAEEVDRPKPAPDVFLKAAHVVGVRPDTCLVIGDGFSDIYGALDANMYAVYLGEFAKEMNRQRVHICLTGPDVYKYIRKLFAFK